MGKEVILGLDSSHTARAQSLQSLAFGDLYHYGEIVNQEMREEGNARLAKFSRRLGRDIFGENYGLVLYGAGFAYDSLPPYLMDRPMSKQYIWKSEVKIDRHTYIDRKTGEIVFRFTPIQKVLHADSPGFFEDLSRQVDKHELNECEAMVIVGAISILLPVYLRRQEDLQLHY